MEIPCPISGRPWALHTPREEVKARSPRENRSRPRENAAGHHLPPNDTRRALTLREQGHHR